jgi:hypothetical protein
LAIGVINGFSNKNNLLPIAQADSMNQPEAFASARNRILKSKTVVGFRIESKLIYST